MNFGFNRKLLGALRNFHVSLTVTNESVTRLSCQNNLHYTMNLTRLVRAVRTKDVVLLRFAIKSTIVGGIVYYTYAEGLWSKSEETAKLYEKLYVNVAPYVKENVPEEIIKEWAQLPSVSCITSFMKTSWNKGVMTSMEFISNIPTHTCNGATNLYETVQKYIQDLNL